MRDPITLTAAEREHRETYTIATAMAFARMAIWVDETRHRAAVIGGAVHAHAVEALIGHLGALIDESTQLRKEVQFLRSDRPLARKNAALTAENERLRRALIAHRADLHNGSSRPCPTCRESAEALGITGRVPDRCALADADAAALPSSRETTDG